MVARCFLGQLSLAVKKECVNRQRARKILNQVAPVCWKEKNYYSQGVRNATATVQDAIESFVNDRFPIRDFPRLY